MQNCSFQIFFCFLVCNVSGRRARLLPSRAAATQAIFIDLFFSCGKRVRQNHKDGEFSSSKNGQIEVTEEQDFQWRFLVRISFFCAFSLPFSLSDARLIWLCKVGKISLLCTNQQESKFCHNEFNTWLQNGG